MIELVEDEPWSAFNYYLGDLRSRVVFNTDVPAARAPARTDRRPRALSRPPHRARDQGGAATCAAAASCEHCRRSRRHAGVDGLRGHRRGGAGRPARRRRATRSAPAHAAAARRRLRPRGRAAASTDARRALQERRRSTSRCMLHEGGGVARRGGRLRAALAPRGRAPRGQKMVGFVLDPTWRAYVALLLAGRAAGARLRRRRPGALQADCSPSGSRRPTSSAPRRLPTACRVDPAPRAADGARGAVSGPPRIAPRARGAVRPPPRPLRVLDPRRGVPHPRARRARRRARDARRRAHRPRLARGRGRALQGGAASTGVKPLLGCEVYVADDRRAQTKGYAHLTLLAETNEGYANLIKLSSLGYLEGYYYKPRVDWELLERHAKGIVALSGCLSGRVCKALEESRPADAAADLDRLAQVFGRDSRLRRAPERGPRRAGADQPAARRARRARPGCRSSRPATSTTCEHEDARAHEALLCIQSGDSLKNPNHWRFETDQFYFKSAGRDGARLPRPRGRAARARSRSPSAATSSSSSAGSCCPRSRRPDGRDAFDYLVELCEKGLERRYGARHARAPGAAPLRAEDDPRDGLRRLLPDRLGLRRLREAERRSASARAAARPPARSPRTASSITDIDPIRYDLLFERFLNPARKDLPDMDIDFAVEGRERVINYVAEKYGRDRVAQIITFGTMAARAAVRDAGRVLEVPYGVVDRIAKLIPEGPGQTLDDCLKPGAELQAGLRRRPGRARDRRPREAARGARPPGLDPRRRRRDRRAAADRGRPAAAEGRRPGGRDAVRDEERRGARPAEDRLPRPAQPRRDRQGGRARRGQVDIGAIPLDDRKTYEMLARGESTGVFQFESSGMREALRQVKPTEFEDLIALVALYRPGPDGATSRSTRAARTARSRSPTSTSG